MSEVHFQNDKMIKWVDRVGFTCTYSLFVETLWPLVMIG